MCTERVYIKWLSIGCQLKYMCALVKFYFQWDSRDFGLLRNRLATENAHCSSVSAQMVVGLNRTTCIVLIFIFSESWVLYKLFISVKIPERICLQFFALL